MTFCLGCNELARKPCHICCKFRYCSSACAYRCADAHLRDCFTPFRGTLFKEVLGSNPIADWMCQVVESVSKKTQVTKSVAKKVHVTTKSHMVLRSQKM